MVCTPLTFGGRATLWVSGNSLAKMPASADGGAFLLMRGGELNALLVELTGLDGGEAYPTWKAPGTQTVDLQARNGDPTVSFVALNVPSLFI